MVALLTPEACERTRISGKLQPEIRLCLEAKGREVLVILSDHVVSNINPPSFSNIKQIKVSKSYRYIENESQFSTF